MNMARLSSISVMAAIFLFLAFLETTHAVVTCPEGRDVCAGNITPEQLEMQQNGTCPYIQCPPPMTQPPSTVNCPSIEVFCKKEATEEQLLHVDTGACGTYTCLPIDLCCEALIAECLSCKNGVSVEEFCETVQDDIPGCPAMSSNITPTTSSKTSYVRKRKVIAITMTMSVFFLFACTLFFACVQLRKTKVSSSSKDENRKQNPKSLEKQMLNGQELPENGPNVIEKA